MITVLRWLAWRRSTVRSGWAHSVGSVAACSASHCGATLEAVFSRSPDVVEHAADCPAVQIEPFRAAECRRLGHVEGGEQYSRANHRAPPWR